MAIRGLVIHQDLPSLMSRAEELAREGFGVRVGHSRKVLAFTKTPHDDVLDHVYFCKVLNAASAASREAFRSTIGTG